MRALATKSCAVLLCWTALVSAGYSMGRAPEKKPPPMPVPTDTVRVTNLPDTNNQPTKVLFVLSSHGQIGSGDQETGYNLQEVAITQKILADSGYTVEFASPKGSAPPKEAVKLDDEASKRFLENPAFKQQIDNTIPFARVSPGQYRALILIGGHGALWDFTYDSTLARIVAAVYRSGGVVASISQGAAGLVNVKLANDGFLVQGKEVTASTNEEEDAQGLAGDLPYQLQTRLIERGAQFVGGNPLESHVVISGRLVTGQNTASAPAVAMAVARLLTGKEGNQASRQ